jgi:DNA-binding SARP family transcriptional activator
MRFAVLGPVTAHGKAGAVALGGRTPRVVLAMLLLHAGRVVAANELAAAIWGDGPPPSAAESLRNHVMYLRRRLGAEAASRIETVAPGYRISVREGELDVQEFLEACGRGRLALEMGEWADAAGTLGAGLALWRGEPFADLPLEHSAAEAQRLNESRMTAWEGRFEAELQRGRHAEVIAELRALTAAWPLREGFHRQLMLALSAAGRQAEALEAYRSARRVLVAELGIEPGPELRATHQRILAGEDAGSARPAPVAPPRAETPRQLPTVAGHFTGRQVELEELRVLTEGCDPAEVGRTVVVCAVDGMAGIGKTTLAVHAGHRLADRFPDGQLFLDLHGYTEGVAPREPGQALDWLLRALGVPAALIPDEGEARAALYRQRLAGSRTLIVLDNAVGEAQVRPLLPGAPGCMVVVTSRRRLKGLDDAHTLSLDPLPPADARTLFRAVAGAARTTATDPLLEEIAQSCGRLPLALRIAGALLRHRPAWSLEHLARLLRDQHRRVPALSDGERDLATILDLSYEGLTERHRLLLRRLALAPAPDTDAYAAAALLATDPGSAGELLEDLVDHNLLISQAAGRYRPHDLIRAHALALADADSAADRHAAVDRLLHYYAYSAQTASFPIARYPRSAPSGPAPAHVPDVPDTEAAWAWLRTERENLEAALAYSCTAAAHEHHLALVAGMSEYLLVDGPYTRTLMVLRAASRTAERHGHRGVYANILTDLGIVQRLTGDVPGAADTLVCALNLHRSLGNRTGEAATLTDLGRVRSLAGDMSGAGEALTEAWEIYRTLGEPSGEAAALGDLAQVRRLTGNPRGAADALTRALEIYREAGNRRGEAGTMVDLGYLQCELGDLTRAADTLTTALEICRANGHHTHEAYALMALGRVWRQTGDLAAAGETLGRVLEMCRADGHSGGEVMTLVELALVRRTAGELETALEAITQALEICREAGNRNNEAWALNHHAAIVAATGDQPHALDLYRRSLAMNRELNKPDDEAIALEGLGECHLTGGDAEAGISHLKKALAQFQNLGMAADTDRVHARLVDLAAI